MSSKFRRIGLRPVLWLRLAWHKGMMRLRRQWLRRTYKWSIGHPRSSAVLDAPALDLPPAAELPVALRDSAERLRLEAEAVLGGEVELLGSGPVSLPRPIDWHRDFKSGYRWPAVFYLDVPVTRLDDDSDAKVPWDLSRAHHLLTLARAAVLFRDERYLVELERQLESWLAANPAGIGINWVNAMEVALRATAWVWIVGTVESWRPLSAPLRERVTRSLQVHGRHIAANLEGTPALRSNHYLSDLLGLLVLGGSLRGDRAASAWSRRAHRAFEREIEGQVHRDGTGFEASSSYHALALEIFLLAWWIAARHGNPFGRQFEDRVWRMLDVSAAISHSSGRAATFGDADDGRVLPASHVRTATHDHVLWLGAAVLGAPRPARSERSDEVAWTYGIAAWERASARPERPGSRSLAFPDGGVYVMTSPRAHVVVRCGDVGQNGNGGHAHNDLLSYELGYAQPLVVDPGTYVYTADPAARNTFRSTASHNTIEIEGEEINPIDPAVLFRLLQTSRPTCRAWEVSGRTTRLAVGHDGYRGLRVGVAHERELLLDHETDTFEVRDSLLGAGGTCRIASYIHLAADVRVRSQKNGRLDLASRADEVTLLITAPGCVVEVAPGYVSPSYGVRVEAPVVVARGAVALPAALSYRFSRSR